MAAATQQVTVAAGQTAQVDFRLTSQALGLDEIVVTGAAGAARRREIGNTISQINPGQMTARTNDIQEILRGAAPAAQRPIDGRRLEIVAAGIERRGEPQCLRPRIGLRQQPRQ